MPIIFVLCIIGSFALRNSMLDVWIMIIFGVIAFYMNRNGYPILPMILALILGKILEEQFRMSLIISLGDPFIFFKKPISLTLLIILGCFLSYIFVKFIKNIITQRKMYNKFGQFYNGSWHQSHDKSTYEVINPCNEEVIGNVSNAKPEDVDKALESAKIGFDKWKKTTPWERSKIIRKAADLIRENKEIIAKWISLEVGKPLKESLAEVEGSADIFEWNSEETKRIFGQSIESRFPTTRMNVYYQPIGVVAALVAWNFPCILASRKISTALAAGCSVICKPDVITPGSVMSLVDIINKAGFPDGAINVLSGDPAKVSEQLISSDIVKKVSITGSTRVGKIVLKQAADKVQRVTMELSGHAPFIVYEDANIEKAVDTAMAAKYRNNGQVCISPSRIFYS